MSLLFCAIERNLAVELAHMILHEHMVQTLTWASDVHLPACPGLEEEVLNQASTPLEVSVKGSWACVCPTPNQKTCLKANPSVRLQLIGKPPARPELRRSVNIQLLLQVRTEGLLKAFLEVQGAVLSFPLTHVFLPHCDTSADSYLQRLCR